MSIDSMMSSNSLVPCHPLLLLLSIFPSIRVFSSEPPFGIKWPKYWSFSFSISPFNEYSGLISFRIDWFDLLAVQGTLKSLLQYYSSKVSILRCLAFLMVQLSHPYMTTGKTSPNLEAVCSSMSGSKCCFLTHVQVSQEAGEVVWYSHLSKNFWQFVVIHTVKGFRTVNKAGVDIFLEFSCFWYDLTDVDNLISDSSAFSKSIYTLGVRTQRVAVMSHV